MYYIYWTSTNRALYELAKAHKDNSTDYLKYLNLATDKFKIVVSKKANGTLKLYSIKYLLDKLLSKAHYYYGNCLVRLIPYLESSLVEIYESYKQTITIQVAL